MPLNMRKENRAELVSSSRFSKPRYLGSANNVLHQFKMSFSWFSNMYSVYSVSIQKYIKLRMKIKISSWRTQFHEAISLRSFFAAAALDCSILRWSYSCCYNLYRIEFKPRVAFWDNCLFRTCSISQNKTQSVRQLNIYN